MKIENSFHSLEILDFKMIKFGLVLPRLMFERFTESDYSHVLSFERARDDIAELIVQVCKNPHHKFDGIVLEVYFQLAGRVQDKHLLRLVEHLGKYILPNFVQWKLELN